MIKIDELIPLLKKGYVAMDKNGEWWWFAEKPIMDDLILQWISFGMSQEQLKTFDIEPADDWTRSLMEVGK